MRAALAAALVLLPAPAAGDAAPACRVTTPNRYPARADPPTPAYNHGNASVRVAMPEKGAIVAGRLPGTLGKQAVIDDDGSIFTKMGWWKGGRTLVVTGRRLDRRAPPLQADVPDGYYGGFQATGLTFPTAGCWRITGTTGRGPLSFTLVVTKSRLGP
jgi:hypothetical protein